MTDTLLDNVPRVTGRHHNRALAQARRAKAVELRMAGKTYQQIADLLGYANKGTVHRILTNALTEHEVDSIDELRFLEAQRLDAVQAAYWDQAMKGDYKAARIVLRIMDQRARLLGLYPAPNKRSNTQAAQEPITVYDFDDNGHLIPVDPHNDADE
ncbi:hypothetical protein [Granulicoccus sp. GXG6511]|uniref:hypothetical protein n=1 Tax=Granulicoccus sp. GXG6511 TaxID=3381351 RepID=UPI003D7DC2B4